MKGVEILAVGSELLTPYFLDTNSLFLTEKLNELGFEVALKTVVGDDEESLAQQLREALSRSDLILVMGGLGPTSDDRTREAVARALSRELTPVPGILERIEARFKRRGLDMPDSNRKQALLIEGAEVLANDFGTAPGQWLEAGGRRLVLLPGPPHELRAMFERQVCPRLEPFRQGHLLRRVIKIAGLTESQVEDLMAGAYPEDEGLSITTLARPGQIELHLTARSQAGREAADRRMESLEKSLLDMLGDHVISRAGEELEEVVGRLMRERAMTLACAESCSGGLLSHRLTNVPGSSGYFLGSVVAYGNRAKRDLLGVPAKTLEEHGAVSERAAEAMAAGARRLFASDIGLAITGIAGPGGETAEKPVGLVFIGLSWDEGILVHRNRFLGNRELVKSQAAQKGLDMLRRHLLGGQS